MFRLATGFPLSGPSENWTLLGKCTLDEGGQENHCEQDERLIRTSSKAHLSGNDLLGQKAVGALFYCWNQIGAEFRFV